MGWYLRLLNSWLSRTSSRAGTCPALAHCTERWLIQLMNTLEAATLLGSCPRLFVITKLWDPPQSPFSEPIWGTVATPHSNPLTLTSSSMFQMPFHMKAFLPFWKAVYSSSWARSLGLYPSLTRSTIQVRASTPAWELKVALVPSSLYSRPP